MTVRDTPWPEGTPCWVEVQVDDPVRTSAFYGRLFGWTFLDHGEEYDHYLTARLDGRNVADIGPRPPGAERGGPSAWLVCLAVDGADAVAERIERAGGKLLVPPNDVGTHGRFAVAEDPAGAVFAIWQADEYPGAQVAGVAGAAVRHHCLSRDVAAAAAFYAAVFGHRVTPGPGAREVTLGLGGQEVASVAAGAEGVASHWRVAFGVVDVDEAVAAVAGLGGSLREGPYATPRGRGAVLADAQGTVFEVLETGP
ncbi:VOC family protein [Streptomyces sp. NRRL B-1347]|uniref:VOC family protein n=1 Tax=Streptomyces sp. NRRL B-1347 TaxID=1476877 RepID=UPI0004C704C2|nr:VOC family protein [Streptomyces sp. NRRL B-1347]